MTPERIGLAYNKPFNVFPVIKEVPIDGAMIYCKDKAHAQLILRQFKKMALDAIEKEYYATHKAIEKMETTNEN